MSALGVVLIAAACSPAQELTPATSSSAASSSSAPTSTTSTSTVSLTELGLSIDVPGGAAFTAESVAPGCDDGRTVTGYRSGRVLAYAVPDGCAVANQSSLNGSHLLLAAAQPDYPSETVQIAGGAASIQAVPYDEYTNEKSSYTDRFGFVTWTTPTAGHPASVTITVRRDGMSPAAFNSLIDSVAQLG